MKPLPDSDDALVIRTDFNDDDAWSAVRTAIETPVDDFQAYVDFVNDPQYRGLTVAQLLGLLGDESEHMFVFIVDSETLASPDHPILVVDLCDEPGRTFRVVPQEAWSVENNLSIANMDWEDFAESVGEDGVFRGF